MVLRFVVLVSKTNRETAPRILFWANVRRVQLNTLYTDNYDIYRFAKSKTKQHVFKTRSKVKAISHQPPVATGGHPLDYAIYV